MRSACRFYMQRQKPPIFRYRCHRRREWGIAWISMNFHSTFRSSSRVSHRGRLTRLHWRYELWKYSNVVISTSLSHPSLTFSWISSTSNAVVCASLTKKVIAWNNFGFFIFLETPCDDSSLPLVESNSFARYFKNYFIIISCCRLFIVVDFDCISCHNTPSPAFVSEIPEFTIFSYLFT